MTRFNFDVITLFPKAFELINNLGVITRALEKNLINVNLHDLREYGEGNYRQVDDKPYGGGSGMVLKPEPIYKAHDSIDKLPNSKTLLMTPQGKVLKQQDLLRWSSLDQLIIICGQYEGFDERVRCLADEEVSIGDYVLSGGEIPSISIINGLTRLLPGTLGDPGSLIDESHNSSLLEYPHYTRPLIFREMRVPDILVSGNHEEIKLWRKQKMLERTLDRRNDLISNDDYKKLPKSKRINRDSNEIMKFRIGNGYDIHRLVEGRDLIIGGVKMQHPDNLGLDGHSDADVLSHSIMDALLGALSLGDIGKYFPPSDQKWKNADSLFLLSKVIELIRKEGWEVNNIDSVIVAERPKIKPHVQLMKNNISNTLQINGSFIGIKATTNEKLGPEGREEGISCHSVVLLEKKE
ncbi:putative bifuntional enzyme: tRNA methyltransferase; 2-C-methyl-D-erythritol 2,4-cyclodiphosphate synthase [Prochlorococcus marinus subsp. pastoris str. CCMP1986]|uniref:Multifunctional fusion protein n=2 Tax=Prochlorococcus TaxID=1218 RepID=Q7V0H7_PROMP|nr:tRNA (guanosine(37)-N1)-methyltransferase TrmD [Prochlorococcus marinus]CAE19739.1 putative bifuntional enzyme: tRNA methyltransferase; 2-C-methyl-D-erythritol 2,4-cyclodiphosphate synthase [Prochlorococcus marinus subsp. pastoris str. CCMP1986]